MLCGDVRDGLCACFAPGTSTAQVERFYSWAAARALPQPYSHQARWTQTATDGTVGGTSPITLTYSFVPDYSTGDPSTSNTIHATFDAKFGSRSAWKNLFADIFEDWATRCGIRFVEVADDAATWPGSPGILGARGDIRITCTAIDGQYGVLAYAYTPNNGDISFDSAENWANAANNYRFLRNTLLHELGHAIGLLHVNPRDGTKLMEALLNLGFEGPQDDDLRGAMAYYGDAYEPNETASAARSLGAFTADMSVPYLALHHQADTDWFELSGVAGATLVATATPTGGAYQVSPDPGTPSSVNTLSVNPLRIEVYDSVGSSLLAAAAASAAGAAAQTGSFIVPGSQSGIRIRVYTNGTTNGVQRYTLTVSQGAPLSRTLTLTSSPAGASAVLSPAAESGASSAVAPAVLNYPAGTAVTVSAAGVSGGYSFVRWRLDGVDQAFGETTLLVVLDSDRTLEAVRTATLAASAGEDQSIFAGGSAQLQALVVGGVGPYSYSWTPESGLSNPASAAPSAAPLETTVYTLTITDGLGRSASDEVRVEVLPALSVSAGADRTVLRDRAFTLTATASGGTPPYSYAWTPEEPLNNPNLAISSGAVAETTVFTVTVTDAGGRSVSDSVLVSVASPLQVRVTGSGAYAPGAVVTLEALVSGGEPPISYAWTPPGTDGLVNEPLLRAAPQRTTTYTVTVTDALQQRVTVGVLVAIAAPLSVLATASDQQISPGARITLSAAVSGGEPPLVYAWSPGNSVAEPEQPVTQATPAASTTFVVTVTDRLGQTASGSVAVRVGGAADLSPIAPAGLCGFGAAFGVVSLLGLDGLRRCRRARSRRLRCGSVA